MDKEDISESEGFDRRMYNREKFGNGRIFRVKRDTIERNGVRVGKRKGMILVEEEKR